MAPTYGWQGQLGIDTVNPITQRFDYWEEELILDEDFLDLNGLRGTRSRDSTRVVSGVRRVHGPIVMYPTAFEWTLLLPWILGGTPSGTSYPLADAIATRYVTIDRGSKVDTYNGVAVNRAVISGREKEGVKLMLDLIGIDETPANSGTFPVLSIDTTKSPFTFMQLVLSVNSTTAQCPEFQLVIDNAIDPDRFFNNQVITTTPAQDRHIQLSHPLPFGDSSSLYGLGVGGVTSTLTFNNGVSTMEFSLVNVKYPRKSPRTPGRGEIRFPMEGFGYKSGATLELVTTLSP